MRAHDVIIYHPEYKNQITELVQNRDIVYMVNILHDVIQWFETETNMLYYQANPFCSENLIRFIAQIPILYRVEFVSKLLANPNYKIIFKKNSIFDPAVSGIGF